MSTADGPLETAEEAVESGPEDAVEISLSGDVVESALVVPCVDCIEPGVPVCRAQARAGAPAERRTERWADVAEQGGGRRDLYFVMRQLEDTVGRFQMLMTASQTRVDGELHGLRKELDRVERVTEELTLSKNVVFRELGKEAMEANLESERMVHEAYKRDVERRARGRDAPATQRTASVTPEGGAWQQQRRRGGRSRRKGAN